MKVFMLIQHLKYIILDSIVVSIPACHAGDRGSIPRRGEFFSIIVWHLEQQAVVPLVSPQVQLQYGLEEALLRCA